MDRQLLTATVLLLAGASACSEGRAEDSGTATSRNYPVGEFSAIEVAGPFDVKVATGKPVAVQARGPQKLLDTAEVVVEGGKLVIRPKRSGWLGGMNWRSSAPVTFTVSAPTLAGAKVAGSGDIDIDRIAGQRFSGSIAGSGSLRLAQVAVEDVSLEIGGSGGIEAAGQARRADYKIAGSGELNAAALRTTETRARVGGSGSIHAYATGSAKASIAGSGDIEISGGAKCETSKAGSGSVRCS